MSRKMFKMVVKPIKINEEKFLRELIKRVDQFREAHGLEPIKGPELGWQGMGRQPTHRRSSGIIIAKTRAEANQILAAKRLELDELYKARLRFSKK